MWFFFLIFCNELPVKIMQINNMCDSGLLIIDI